MFTTENAVILLDGASQPDPSEHDGGWLAETLGRELHARLTVAPDADLVTSLTEAIASVAERHRLRPGSSPSTTVGIARWDEKHVDVLVLGDNPVLALTSDDRLHEVRDDRLHLVAREQRGLLARATPLDRARLRRDLVEVECVNRNRTGGYWIAEAVPQAAKHARRARWRRDDVAAVLLVTDGISIGVDRYGVPADWRTAFSLALEDPAELVRVVHDAEASDPDCLRWPRSKPHDDKACAIISLGQGPPACGFRSV